MAKSFKTIEVSAEDGVLTVTLNRPDSLNALTPEMSVELSGALKLAQRDASVRCVVITGAGKAFCAGQDLRELQAAYAAGDDRGEVLGEILQKHYNPLISSIRALEKPVLASVNGVAAGGGAALAFACDLRIAAQSAKFKLAFADIGLVPDMGSTLMLVQHAGYARAAELCMLSEPLSAEDALAYGLVNRVAADDHLEAVAGGLAARLASLPPKALALTKRALNRVSTAMLDSQLEYERFLQQTAARTADHEEGVSAFMEKRKPKFEGK